MNDSTLHSLFVAKILFDEARKLCDEEDRYSASAALIALQDSLEIVFHAILTEKGVDDEVSIKGANFDQLMGYLRKAGLKIKHRGGMTALNKDRVLAKHHGQLREPINVRTYVERAKACIDSLLEQAVGQNFDTIFLPALLDEGESREFLESAAQYIQSEKYIDALTEIRKAVFVEIEYRYSIHDWSEIDSGGQSLAALVKELGGEPNYAPAERRNRQWIASNVKDPSGYVQIDREHLRIDALDWGINTVDLLNLLGLTPEVFRASRESAWKTKYRLPSPSNMYTKENANYCLDRAIAIIRKIQAYKKSHRNPQINFLAEFKQPELGKYLYVCASVNSKVVHSIDESKYGYRCSALMSGLDDGSMFYHVHASINDEDSILSPLVHLISGYMPFKANTNEK